MIKYEDITLLTRLRHACIIMMLTKYDEERVRHEQNKERTVAKDIEV